MLNDWGNKGRDMCYTVCMMVYIKEPLLLIGKINHMFNVNNNYVTNASLNKTFLSFLP